VRTLRQKLLGGTTSDVGTGSTLDDSAVEVSALIED
jgi:hypothetical protein